MNNIKLICLPFAGGSSYSYNRFERYLPPHISLINPELPGRGTRIVQPLLTDLHLMTADLMKILGEGLNEPYAIYGHSMGALLGYLLTHRIISEKWPPPLHLFLSGRGGPTAENFKLKRYDLPQQEFFQVLRELGGCPEEVLNDPDLMGFFEPILRADFKAVETYEYHSPKKLMVPIDLFIGTLEDIPHYNATLWEAETKGPFELTYLEGDHFFIYEREQELIEYIIKKLTLYGK